MGGRSFSTAFERRERFLLVGELLWRYWRDCNRRVWKRKISASGPPLGNVEGARLLGLLRERDGWLWKRSISYEINLGSFFGPRLC